MSLYLSSRIHLLRTGRACTSALGSITRTGLCLSRLTPLAALAPPRLAPRAFPPLPPPRDPPREYKRLSREKASVSTDCSSCETWCARKAAPSAFDCRWRCRNNDDDDVTEVSLDAHQWQELGYIP